MGRTYSSFFPSIPYFFVSEEKSVSNMYVYEKGVIVYYLRGVSIDLSSTSFHCNAAKVCFKMRAKVNVLNRHAMLNVFMLQDTRKLRTKRIINSYREIWLYLFMYDTETSFCTLHYPREDGIFNKIWQLNRKKNFGLKIIFTHTFYLF